MTLLIEVRRLPSRSRRVAPHSSNDPNGTAVMPDSREGERGGRGGRRRRRSRGKGGGGGKRRRRRSGRSRVRRMDTNSRKVSALLHVLSKCTVKNTCENL
jgi:hypothetical protein